MNNSKLELKLEDKILNKLKRKPLKAAKIVFQDKEY